MKTRQYITELVAGIYIAVLLLTGITKWADMPAFYGQMERMPFPDWMAAPVAYGLPTTMGILALWLIFGTHRRLPVFLSLSIFVLLALFIKLIINYTFGPEYPCACAGLFDLSWNDHFTGLIVLSLLGGIVLLAIKPAQEQPMVDLPELANRLRRKIFT